MFHSPPTMDFDLGNLTLPLSVDAQTAAKVNPDRAPSHARTYAYPKYVWYSLASFIALISVCHFTIKFVSWLHSRTRTVKPATRGPRSLRRIPAVVLNVVRNVVFRITVSFGRSYTLNLTELFLGCAYIAFLFTWAFINTTNLEGVYISPQYYANRAGLIAATQLPFLIALGMKNNILTLLTGISFDKLNILHRIAARTLCVLLWTHAAGHIIENGTAGNIEDLQETWFRCGIMAISAFTLLCLFSVQPLRSRAYELFLIAHLFLVLIMLGAVYYHVNNNGLGYYIWPSLMVWGLDRFLRLIRIFFVNGGYLTLFGTKTSPSLRATIEVISPQFLRVKVRRPDFFRWSPGQLAYLSIPSVSAMPWEAHPFTIASIDGNIPRATDGHSSSGENSPSEKDVSFESELVTAQTLLPPGYSKELVFLLRVHDGFTKRLLHAASSPTTTNRAFNAYIDGPYCSPPSVRGFETVLLFGGGSGISFILPLLLDVIKAANMAVNPICRKVVMVWAIRNPEHVNAISDDLLRALDGVSESLLIDICIHVTASNHNSANDDEKASVSISDTATKLLEAQHVRVLSGRPDITAIIKSEVDGASGSMSVNVCGTAGLAENVRSALRAASTPSDILKGGPSIRLHVEAFGM
ncbi:Ferric/cupric reductase transmembrane component 1 [Mycena venus]|uniref:Ferric/cupric reductase transmembrane component 1 n=1 Tax=Mycena venus TaxID=2733690 RepID=A0A8H7D3G6_9AGAR|nr:Ferric/cupric reductase transmembrane component 1 [Mycena venus]